MNNALAYYNAQLIIAVKVFLIQALGKEDKKKESLLQLFSLKILTKKPDVSRLDIKFQFLFYNNKKNYCSNMPRFYDFMTGGE
jgi:hypothetical protein